MVRKIEIVTAYKNALDAFGTPEVDEVSKQVGELIKAFAQTADETSKISLIEDMRSVAKEWRKGKSQLVEHLLEFAPQYLTSVHNISGRKGQQKIKDPINLIRARSALGLPDTFRL